MTNVNRLGRLGGLLLLLLLPSLALGQSLYCEPTIFAQGTSSYLSNFNAATSIANDLAIAGYGSTSVEIPSGEFTPGVAVIYEYNSSTTAWGETQRFQGSASVTDEAFGYSVAITDRIFDGVAFIGIPTEQRVLVIAKNPSSGVWEGIQNLTISADIDPINIDEDDIQGFGSSLAIGVASAKAGSKLQVLVVGAPNSFDNLGAAFLFVNATNSWPPTFILAQTLVVSPSSSSSSSVLISKQQIPKRSFKAYPPPPPTNCSMFGASVAVANSGTNVVIGAPSSDRPDASGCAFIFGRFVAPPPNSTTPPSDLWELLYSLPASVGMEGTPGDLFGASVGTWGR